MNCSGKKTVMKMLRVREKIVKKRRVMTKTMVEKMREKRRTVRRMSMLNMLSREEEVFELFMQDVK